MKDPQPPVIQVDLHLAVLALDGNVLDGFAQSLCGCIVISAKTLPCRSKRYSPRRS
jgi:hypothetical protein